MKTIHAVAVALLLGGLAVAGCKTEMHQGGPAPAATTRGVEEIEIEKGGAPPPGMRVSYPGAPGQAVEKREVIEDREVIVE